MVLTTYTRTWQDFEWVTLATMPMLLFSATFFPIDALPPVASCGWSSDPADRGACRAASAPPDADQGLARSRSSTWSAMGMIGRTIARRRLDKPLLT